MHTLDRPALRDLLHRAFEPLDSCRALYEAGSPAFGRADADSDLDLALMVLPDSADEALAVADATLRHAGTVTACWDVPASLVPVHKQRFVQLEEAGPLVLVDLTVMPLDCPPFFLDPMRHGTPRICFDKDDRVHPELEDRADLDERRRQALDQLRIRVALFGGFAAKEARRGRAMDALTMWQRMVIGPLTTALRATHDPDRWDFGGRYLDRDLPAADRERLERLAYVSGPDAIVARWPEAEAWLDELLGPP